MHVPIGRSGVHAVPKTLHSQGLMTPLSTSPHWHALGSATRTPGTAKRFSASSSGVGLGQLQAALRDEPQAAPLEVRAQLEDLGHHLERLRVALVRHDARVLVLDLAAPLGELREDHVDRVEDVERLEARDDARLAVLRRDELERARADDRRDVARPDEAVEAQVGRLEQRAQRRHDRHVVAHAPRSCARPRPSRA